MIYILFRISLSCIVPCLISGMSQRKYDLTIGHQRFIQIQVVFSRNRLCHFGRHRSIRVLILIRRQRKFKDVSLLEFTAPHLLCEVQADRHIQVIMDRLFIFGVILAPLRLRSQFIRGSIVCHRHNCRQLLIGFINIRCLGLRLFYRIGIGFGVGCCPGIPFLITGVRCCVADRSEGNLCIVFPYAVLTFQHRFFFRRHRCAGSFGSKGECKLIVLLDGTSSQRLHKLQIHRCGRIVVDRTSRAAPGICSSQFILGRIIFHRYRRRQDRVRLIGIGSPYICLLHMVRIGLTVSFTGIVSILIAGVIHRIHDLFEGNFFVA